MSVTSLPPANNYTALAARIVSGYQARVAALAKIPDDKTFKDERNNLIWGSLRGSRVDGVRNAKDVEELLSRCVMQGPVVEQFVDATPYQDGDNNTVYCFPFSHQYIGKGHTTYVRIGVLRKIKPEIAELALSNGEFAVDYDDEADADSIKPQFPKVKNVKCNVVTVILGPTGEFINWFCGYPTKIYNRYSIVELLAADGSIDMTNVWVRLSLDYNIRSRERQHRKRQASRQQPRQPKTNTVQQHEPIGMASVEAALQEAGGTAALEAAYDQGLQSQETVPSVPVAEQPVV